jgi:NFU1 iron-sulfur cluster scaffold homolog, mitochondrial
LHKIGGFNPIQTNLRFYIRNFVSIRSLFKIMSETIVPISIYMEATPNPASMKYVVNKLITEPNASGDYKDFASTRMAPLAQKLFEFPFVRHVFISNNFITITKANFAEWEDIQIEIKDYLTDYLRKGNPVILEYPKLEVPKDSSMNETVTIHGSHVSPKSITETKIIEIIDEYIKPAVENDGGQITFKSLEDKKVTVVMRGACSGCPSSTMTLKGGIEGLLKRMLPGEVEEVIAE